MGIPCHAIDDVVIAVGVGLQLIDDWNENFTKAVQYNVHVFGGVVSAVNVHYHVNKTMNYTTWLTPDMANLHELTNHTEPFLVYTHCRKCVLMPPEILSRILHKEYFEQMIRLCRRIGKLSVVIVGHGCVAATCRSSSSCCYCCCCLHSPSSDAQRP